MPCIWGCRNGSRLKVYLDKPSCAGKTLKQILKIAPDSTMRITNTKSCSTQCACLCVTFAALRVRAVERIRRFAFLVTGVVL